MRKKKAQIDVGTSTQGDDKDDRVDRLFDIVERFLERDLRREENALNPPPPPIPPPRAENNDYVSERFQKLRPPIFEGDADPKVSENWIQIIKRMFSYGKIPDDSKVSCAIFFLRDSASYLWDTIVCMILLQSLGKGSGSFLM